MHSDAEMIDALAPGLNNRINIPGPNEATEEEYLRGVLSYVVPGIPVAIRPLMFDGADGLDDEERDKHAKLVLDAAVANVVSQTPLIARGIVETAIRTVLEPVVADTFRFIQRGFAIGLPEGGV